jgi:sec-independent protein translocase protein TatA
VIENAVTTQALFGDIGGGELLVVFAAILLLFGGKRLPSIARSIGKATENLRRASQDFKDQLLRADVEDTPAPASPNRLPPPDPSPVVPAGIDAAPSAPVAGEQKEPVTCDSAG